MSNTRPLYHLRDTNAACPFTLMRFRRAGRPAVRRPGRQPAPCRHGRVRVRASRVPGGAPPRPRVLSRPRAHARPGPARRAGQPVRPARRAAAPTGAGRRTACGGRPCGPGETGRSLRETLACTARRSSRSATPSRPGPGPSEHEGVGSMDSRRILIKNGTVITMDNTIGDFASADVLVHGAIIEAVGPNLRQPDAELIDATGMVVMPGLIDTHRHTWQAALRGIAADWTLGQYMTGLHLGLSGHFQPEDTYAGNLLGAVEALDSGITTLLDWSHNVNTAEHSDAAVAGLREAGIRAVFAHGGGADMYQVPSNVPHDQDIRRIRER